MLKIFLIITDLEKSPISWLKYGTFASKTGFEVFPLQNQARNHFYLVML